MFNGVLENQGDVSRKPIPNEAKVLGEPYILLYNSSIKTKPDEPNWSLNMKRAIAGILYVDINKINEMKAYSEEVIINLLEVNGRFMLIVSRKLCMVIVT